MGIARVLVYGGYPHNVIYDPQLLLTKYKDARTYHHKTISTINYFYEKLLNLVSLMNTLVAKN